MFRIGEDESLDPAHQAVEVSTPASVLRAQLTFSTEGFQENGGRLLRRENNMGPLVQARLHEMYKASQGTNGSLAHTRSSRASVGLRNQEFKIEMENIVASRKLPVKKIAELVDTEGTLQLSEALLSVARDAVPLSISEDTSAQSERGSGELICAGPRNSARSLPLPKNEQAVQRDSLSDSGAPSSRWESCASQSASVSLLDFMDALRDLGIVPHKLGEEDAVLAFSAATAAADGAGGDALPAEQYQDLLASLIRVGIVDFVEAMQAGASQIFSLSLLLSLSLSRQFFCAPSHRQLH
jgi:hypothetical protein